MGKRDTTRVSRVPSLPANPLLKPLHQDSAPSPSHPWKPTLRSVAHELREVSMVTSPPNTRNRPLYPADRAATLLAAHMVSPTTPQVPHLCFHLHISMMRLRP